MRKRISFPALSILMPGMAGCRRVATRDGHTILSSPPMAVIGLGLLGFPTVAIGVAS